MSVDQLVETLLYEGYALYPYTPEATKNATPTPFGIVYPPAYAAGSGATHDRLRLQVLAVVDGDAEPELEAEVRFLQATGARHQAVERRVEPGAFELDPLRGRVSLSTEGLGGGRWLATLLVENVTPFEGESRAEALGRSLLSTHPVLRLHGGRFVSPLEAEGCESVNTWPVLASPDDDVVVGAAIVLPDHPQLAPESRGHLFDATEIEEALLLHVHALSDAEREAIGGQDATVREMVERAAATGPDELLALHGVMRPVDEPLPLPRLEGEPEAKLDGATVRPGTKLLLRLSHRTDVYDRLLDGRAATLERIYYDVDGKLYLGVTIDDDPGRELMRETGRLHFFFADEVEVVP